MACTRVTGGKGVFSAQGPAQTDPEKTYSNPTDCRKIDNGIDNVSWLSISESGKTDLSIIQNQNFTKSMANRTIAIPFTDALSAFG
jgi:hypothetical protein